MKKCVIENVNGIKVQVLDTRKAGVCLDVELEITEGDNRGIAMLKLYGPNKMGGFIDQSIVYVENTLP